MIKENGDTCLRRAAAVQIEVRSPSVALIHCSNICVRLLLLLLVSGVNFHVFSALPHTVKKLNN